MKTLILAMAFALLTSSGFTWAQGRAGNGGGGVVCFSDPAIAQLLIDPWFNVARPIPNEFIPKITSIQAIDLFGLDLDDVIPWRADKNYESTVADRFKTYLPEIPHLLITGRNQVTASSGRLRIYDDHGVLPIDDVDVDEPAPKGCIYSTIIVHNSATHELHIDFRLLTHPKHPMLSRDLLFLHEYLLAAITPVTSEKDLRSFIQHLISKSVSADALIQDLVNLKLISGFSDLELSRKMPEVDPKQILFDGDFVRILDQ